MKWKWRIIKVFCAEGLEFHPESDRTHWKIWVQESGFVCVLLVLLTTFMVSWLHDLAPPLPPTSQLPGSLGSLGSLAPCPQHPFTPGCLSSLMPLMQPLDFLCCNNVHSTPPGQPFSSITPRTAPPSRPLAETPLFLVTISLPSAHRVLVKYPWLDPSYPLSPEVFLGFTPSPHSYTEHQGNFS